MIVVGFVLILAINTIWYMVDAIIHSFLFFSLHSLSYFYKERTLLRLGFLQGVCNKYSVSYWVGSDYFFAVELLSPSSLITMIAFF